MSRKDGPRLSPERALRALPAIRELEQIISAPDAKALVQQMPSVQLNELVNRLGLADAGPLLALSSPGQVREIVDLQVWQGDRVVEEELLDWLDEIRAAHNPGWLLRALDIELLGFAIRRTARLFLLAEEDEPELPEGLLYTTPDGWFAVDIRGDADRAARLRELIEAMYDEDVDEARRLLQNLQWELPDELEEWALRWRQGRLADLGFADPFEALEIYSYLDPSSVSADENTADRTLRNDPEPVAEGGYALALLSGEPASFWSRAVARLPQEERERLGPALLAVANRALCADRVPKANLELGRESLDQLLWRLSLGLEHLADGDVDRAAAALRRVALMRVARLGHSLVLDLRQRLLRSARRKELGRRPGALDLIDLPLRDQLTALLGQRPQIFEVETDRARPFRDREDLRRAACWIDAALSAPRLVPEKTRPAPLPSELTFGDLFRTDVANSLIEHTGPLRCEDVARLVREFTGQGKLLPEVLYRADALAVQRAGAPLPEPAAQLVAGWMTRLEEEIGALSPDDIDLRFLSGLYFSS